MEPIAHITAEEIAQYGVVAAPDRLIGRPADNKAVFDRLVRELVAVVVNRIIDKTNDLLTVEEVRQTQETQRVEAEAGRVREELLRVAAETARVQAEQLRAAAETARAQAEQLRTQAEAARVQAEESRATAETERADQEGQRTTAETERAVAEALRKSAEEVRQTQEAQRVETEAGRVHAEQLRVAAETARAQVEQLRAQAEAARVQAEESRATAETGRADQEGQRTAAETERAAAEALRRSAEEVRQTQEAQRVEAEAARGQAEQARSLFEAYDPEKTYVPGNKVSFGGSSWLAKAQSQGVTPAEGETWLLIARRGLDGEGSGDMLAEDYDPTGKRSDVYAYAERVTDTHAKDGLLHLAAGERERWNDPTEAKAEPADEDSVTLRDSAAEGAHKRLTWAAIKVALGKVFAAVGHSHAWGELTGMPGAFAPAAHKDTHKTGGADALAPADIGAAATSHNHSAANITSGTLPLARGGTNATTAAAARTQLGACARVAPVTVTLTAAGWAGSGPWTQAVTVSGVVAADTHLGVFPVNVADAAARKLYETAYGCLAPEADTAAGKVTFTCYSGKPATNFQVRIQGVR